MKKFAWLLATASLCLPLAVSAQDATPEAEDTMEVAAIELPAVDPLTIEGDIVTAGSSTVYPVAEVIAQQFTDEGYLGNLTLDSIGSGAGIQRFCNGEIDIANASRAINEEEVAACEANGLTPIEFTLGLDALTVVVSPSNDFVTDLTIEQLAQIFSGEITNWSQINPEWPDRTIALFSPSTAHGTFDYFIEAVMEEGLGLESEEAEAALLNAPGIQLSDEYNVLASAVEGTQDAIGYLGFAYFDTNREQLTAVAVEGVEPSEATAESGEYALARPLFMYSDAGIMAEKPQVGQYISYFLSNVNDVITEVGYFPASVENLNIAKAEVLMALGMEDQIPAEVLEMMATPEA